MKRQLLWTLLLAVGACGPAGEDIDALVKQEVAQQEQSVLQADSSAGLTATQKILSYNYQVQQTGYWCGPASTRIALSVRMASPPTQAQLAGQLGTTTAGTNHIGLVTSVLNADLRTTYYENKWMPNDPPTTAQRDLLWRDITYDIDRNYALVANIVAPASNHPPCYPNYTIYHYVAVVGYKVDSAGNRWALIADPANFCGDAKPYWLTFNQLATLIPPKGYSA
ncbi:MAG TPA: C39 family peptidase [Pseudomonadota bacterium]|nr:C39 family peptidase [Pseudomonadota bacterium]HNN54636.1 C39 family peptidase [Pseudomonadota bacterium]